VQDDAPPPAADPVRESRLLHSRWYPLAVLGRFALVFVAALGLGLFLPSAVAMRGGTFYEKTLPMPTGAAAALRAYEQKRQDLQRRIDRIDTQLLAPAPVQGGADRASALFGLRELYQRRLDALPAPVVKRALFLNPIMYLWPGLYCTLGTVVFLLAPPCSRRQVRPWPTLLLAAGVHVLYDWTSWVRNFVLADEGRRVYSYANYDVSRAGFWMQEANMFLLAVLLAVLWQQWAAFFVERREALTAEATEDARAGAFDARKVERLSVTFLNWQLSALLVSAGFVAFTSVYWDLIIKAQDVRYVLPGILAHGLWLISLGFVTLPLVITWYVWQSRRVQAAAAFIASGVPSGQDLGVVLEELRALQPIGFWNLASSSIAVLVAFLLPILQAFIK
jgi:hypothetical protein